MKPGDRIEQFDKICEVQSDKASVEITSRYDGVIRKLYYDVGAMARVGRPLVDIETGADKSTETQASPVSSPTSPSPQPTSSSSNTASVSESNRDEAYILTTPAVRRLAKEQSIDLAQVRGTGKNGRITKEDVMMYTQDTPQRQAVEHFQSGHVATDPTPSHGMLQARNVAAAWPSTDASLPA